MAANCLPCFRYHYKKLKKLDVLDEEIKEVIEIANKVKKQPDQHMEELIEKKLEKKG